MLTRYYEVGRSKIMDERVPMALVSNYGVADCGDHKLVARESKAMTAVVEKKHLQI
jgi:UTP--glucose-1-phosphate uridylyltransferase